MNDPTSPLDAGDLDSLLGAYALDALDAADRARVDAYLAQDAAARSEVDEMRETAASLALLPDSPMDAPPALWARISEVIESERAPAAAPATPGAPGPIDELAARRAKRVPWIASASVAAAIVVVVLAVQVVSLHSRLDNAQGFGTKSAAAAFTRATEAQGARQVGLQSGSGATLARLVLLPDGTGYFKGDHLASLGSDRTYQLWALTGSTKSPIDVSAGVLGPDPSAVAFHASGPVHGFAVTVEPAGGVVVSHHSPVASAVLS